ncbi:DegT/DnrJ/EryC1/StrS family aminotransferase [Candidatus Nitrosacidococcus tergens]|uniref:Pleiotropic regulatory protein n=1 Tax=Candidatus Nitrosacidococcus tergens TaxID=553981 RepID=A0A7G1Q921_9GAMM|nr:DegT/DnrJ/EryC1/StrS family aminotransferase [Candidatus Nitrosacidococcus tergens]CAB1275427.1 Pleiotropic regulatory protein [Candidatus Nitrosacidococcus tergens]
MLPMVDLKAQYQVLKEELNEAVLHTLANGQFILGPNVEDFEKEAAAYLGAQYAISVASGTDALHLALIAAGVKAGDEVITSPFTFIATAEAICYVGAHPVFVDIDEKTFNLDTNQVEAAITPVTRAILPVHLFGQGANMVHLETISAQYGLSIIEDCAQSFGAEINGKKTGTLGFAGCFSFFPSKNLGCYGDGGLITTSSKEVSDHLKVLRNHGSSKRYHHIKLGFNSRLDELQAVILRVKLKYIDQFNKARNQIAQQYTETLTNLPYCIPPYKETGNTHVYHQYTLLSPYRDEIMKALTVQHITSAIYYPIPLHQQVVFQQIYQDVHFPVSEKVAKQCLSLPIFPEMSESQIEQVLNVVQGVLFGK